MENNALYRSVFFFSSRRRHTRLTCDWSSDVCSSDLLVLELRQQVAPAEIDSVQVATYGEALRRTATEVEKWNPETRETADHSMPYLVAAAWQDGEVTPATFAPSRIQDPALRPLIKKLTVVEAPE